MEEIRRKREEISEEDVLAEVEIWKYVFGFVEMGVIKCAIDLGIADLIQAQGKPMTLPELLVATHECSLSKLYRLMRFLVHRNIFKEVSTSDGVKSYDLTPISRLLVKHGERSMAAFLLLESSPVMLAPWHAFSGCVPESGKPAFEAAHGVDVWGYASGDPEHSELINEAMACDARLVVPAILEDCPSLFDGVQTVVDVGGGNGTTLGMLVKAYPWLKGTNFDLPHVASVAPKIDNVEHVGGDFFVNIPKADAAFVMWSLHDWGDEECINILRKCKEAIPKDGGKVIIVEAVIDEVEEHEFKDVRYVLDMVMMAHTSAGKERTQEDWTNILRESGFSRHTIYPIRAIQAVIVAWP